MSKKSKIASAALVLGSIASAAGAIYMYRNFFRRPKTFNEEEHQDLLDQLLAQRNEEIWEMTAFDGLNLKAHYFAGEEESHVYAILVHGYTGTFRNLLPQAVHFMEKGYHLLMPDLRGHGLSDGDYIGFGFHEHYDMQGYISMIIEKDPEAQIFLFGLSMGAATVMMTSGEFLPANVKCIIEDCGYTSAWEQCKYNVQNTYHMPPFPILSLANIVMKLKHHYSFKEASPLRAVSKAVVPMLFIHGDQDDFVPFSMHQPLFDACSSTKKELLVVPGAKHAESIFTNPDLYYETVDAFLNQHLS